jgi:uncharacterized protein YbjT (DUF2867 family)
MRVLLTGASGFIGQHLLAALRARGHAVVCAGRERASSQPRMDCDEFVAADFAHDVTVETWLPRLRGVDAVINAVGIFREHGPQTFEALHVKAPCALFDACERAGVRRVIQVSALGADEHASSAFHLSKRRADRHLASLPLSWTIVQPSLVFGLGGRSASLFCALASLPLIPLPGRGDQRVQPIHIDDLTAGMVALLDRPLAGRSVIPFVGCKEISLRHFLEALRRSMGLGRALFLPIPLPLINVAARVGALLPGSLLETDSLKMLQRGNTADPTQVTEAIGHPPRPASELIDASEKEPLRQAAQLSWLLPMLRLSIAAVWIVTAIVSVGVFPREQSYELLVRTGVPANLAPFFLYSAAVLDLVLGFATLIMRQRRWLWIAQIGLILVYTVIISVRLPEFWMHPYGPLLKNLPMLAALILLHALEKR